MLPSTTSFRPLVLAAAAGLGLSLLSAAPASAHNMAGTSALAGFSHPLLGLDHLLMLVGVGAAASFVSAQLLLFALAGGVLGGVAGLLGGQLPQAELLAALGVALMGLLVLGTAGSRRAPSLPWCGALITATVAVHGLLHGQEAHGSAGWWVGALLGSSLVVALSFTLLRRLRVVWTQRLATLLTLSGGVLALAALGLGS
jgi:urease accessory protein